MRNVLTPCHPFAHALQCSLVEAYVNRIAIPCIPASHRKSSPLLSPCPSVPPHLILSIVRTRHLRDACLDSSRYYKAVTEGCCVHRETANMYIILCLILEIIAASEDNSGLLPTYPPQATVKRSVAHLLFRKKHTTSSLRTLTTGPTM